MIKSMEQEFEVADDKPLVIDSDAMIVTIFTNNSDTSPVPPHDTSGEQM